MYSVADIKQTYFARFLNDIKDTDAVYKPNLSAADIAAVYSDEDATKQPKNKWQQLYETKDLFEDRRERFLDHLLARFAESFNDYALLMYTINYNEQTEEKIDSAELIAAKIKTLKNYDDISSNRGKAFNYFPQHDDLTIDTTQIWDTLNVSGLEKRISFLTGIQDPSRRFLYCIQNIEVICMEKEVTENGQVILKCFHSFYVESLAGVRLDSLE
ncbi:MAG TPA: hypothetical protein VNS32_16690, partial [Flavisolibacter sp.]|nr:hypothetical protein [Flavisolibacter sp.]